MTVVLIPCNALLYAAQGQRAPIVFANSIPLQEMMPPPAAAAAATTTAPTSFCECRFVQSYKLTSQIFFLCLSPQQFLFLQYFARSVRRCITIILGSLPQNHHWLNESIIFARSCKDATKCNALKGMKLVISHKFSS